MPPKKVKITEKNLSEWFDVYTDYEHAAEDYRVVNLKVAFAPKCALNECTVVVTYRHNAQWDTYFATAVSSSEKQIELSATRTVYDTASGAYGDNEYDVKQGTNTVSIIKVEGYVVKSQTPWQRQAFANENGTALAQKLANFQSVFDNATAVLVDVESSKCKTTVFGDAESRLGHVELRYNRQTEDICAIDYRVRQGDGYFASGDTFVPEALRDGSVSVFVDSTVEDARRMKNEYSKILTLYSNGDAFGSVAQVDENRFIAKSRWDNVRFYADGASWTEEDIEHNLFDMETAYNFDTSGKKLVITQKILLWHRQGETQSYEICATNTYVIKDSHVRLADEYPLTAQQTPQLALQNLLPQQVDSSKTFTVALSTNGAKQQWFTANFQRGMYKVSSDTNNVNFQLYKQDGETRVDVNEYNELDGLYLVCVGISSAAVPSQAEMKVEKSPMQTFPNYQNPIVVGADGKLQGTVECWGDAVVFSFSATQDGLYQLDGNKNGNDLSVEFSLGEDESYVYPQTDAKLLKLQKGEYQIVVSTNNKNSSSFHFDLTLEYSAVQLQNYTLTNTAQQITIVKYQAVCCYAPDGVTATFTVATDGTYKIVVNPSEVMDGYVLLFDADGKYISKNYGTQEYTLAAGTYTVQYSASQLSESLVVTTWWEKVA